MEIRLPNFVVRLLERKPVILLLTWAFFLFLPVLMIFGAGGAALQKRKKRQLACSLVCPNCGVSLDRASVARADAQWKVTMRELLKKDPQARVNVIRYLDAICGACAADITIEEEPNQALEPTPPSVTPRAVARVAPAGGVAHL
jgi:hypothetical protein